MQKLVYDRKKSEKNFNEKNSQRTFFDEKKPLTVYHATNNLRNFFKTSNGSLCGLEGSINFEWSLVNR